jgi:hypothetical protein
MILAVAESSVREPKDLHDIHLRHQRLLSSIAAMDEEQATAGS